MCLACWMSDVVAQCDHIIVFVASHSQRRLAMIKLPAAQRSGARAEDTARSSFPSCLYCRSTGGWLPVESHRNSPPNLRYYDHSISRYSLEVLGLVQLAKRWHESVVMNNHSRQQIDWMVVMMRERRCIRIDKAFIHTQRLPMFRSRGKVPGSAQPV